jgi:biotin-(acetyl-CoA carboxylase) ligase
MQFFMMGTYQVIGRGRGEARFSTAASNLCFASSLIPSKQVLCGWQHRRAPYRSSTSAMVIENGLSRITSANVPCGDLGAGF